VKFKIEQKYCWYNKETEVVLMYFISGVPFTFDELPDDCSKNPDIIEKANKEIKYEPEDLYKSSFYLIDEEAHPLLFDVDLENPEMLPVDIQE
jgi:hypothetical protein